jgi:hypothetical protein
MREIQLSKGYVAYVSECDYVRVAARRWHAKVRKGVVYAATYVQRKAVYMHRFILDAPHGVQVDHIDHNGLNNARDNIRLATSQQNMRNRRTGSTNTSGVKGVWWCRNAQKWRAALKIRGKPIQVGYFSTKEEAAIAIARKRAEMHGEYACDL